MSCSMHLKKIAEANRWRTIGEARETAVEKNGIRSHSSLYSWPDDDNSPSIRYTASGDFEREKKIVERALGFYEIGVGELAKMLVQGRITQCSMGDVEIGKLMGAMDISLQYGRSASSADRAGKAVQNAIAAVYVLGAVINPELPSYFLDRLHQGTGSAVIEPDTSRSSLLNRLHGGKNGTGRLLKTIEDIVRTFPIAVEPIRQTLESYQRDINAATLTPDM